MWRIKATFLDLLITATVIILLCLLNLDYIPTGKLGYTCKDPVLSYPYKGDTITEPVLLSVTFIGPIMYLILSEWFTEGSFSLKKIHKSTIWFYCQEYLTGTIACYLITALIKHLIGAPRPHFLTSCKPDTNINCIPGAFVQDFNCTNASISFTTDLYQSFPSGHTAMSVLTTLFCSYHILTRIPTKRVTRLTKPLLICIFLCWSLLCSLTRISDRRHHWWDVLGGAVLAVVVFICFSNTSYSRKKITDQELKSNASSTTLGI